MEEMQVTEGGPAKVMKTGSTEGVDAGDADVNNGVTGAMEESTNGVVGDVQGTTSSTTDASMDVTGAEVNKGSAQESMETNNTKTTEGGGEATEEKSEPPKPLRKPKVERPVQFHIYVASAPEDRLKEPLNDLFKANNLEVSEVTVCEEKSWIYYGQGSLANKEDEEKVLELNGQTVDNRLLSVEIVPEPEYDKMEGPDECILVVRNIGKTTADESITDFFPGVIDMRVPENNGRNRGFAFLKFSTPEEVDTMIETKHEKELDGRKLRLSKYITREEPEPTHPTIPEMLYTALTSYNTQGQGEDEDNEVTDISDLPKTKILEIGNLNFDTSEADLIAVFPKCWDARIVTRRDGKSKGVGFLEFRSTKDATKALKKMKNKVIDGRLISLDFGDEKEAGFDRKRARRPSDSRDPRDPRDSRDSRDPKDSRDFRDPRDGYYSSRDYSGRAWADAPERRGRPDRPVRREDGRRSADRYSQERDPGYGRRGPPPRDSPRGGRPGGYRGDGYYSGDGGYTGDRGYRGDYDYGYEAGYSKGYEGGYGEGYEGGYGGGYEGGYGGGYGEGGSFNRGGVGGHSRGERGARGGGFVRGRGGRGRRGSGGGGVSGGYWGPGGGGGWGPGGAGSWGPGGGGEYTGAPGGGVGQGEGGGFSGGPGGGGGGFSGGPSGGGGSGGGSGGGGNFSAGAGFTGESGSGGAAFTGTAGGGGVGGVSGGGGPGAKGTTGVTASDAGYSEAGGYSTDAAFTTGMGTWGNSAAAYTGGGGAMDYSNAGYGDGTQQSYDQSYAGYYQAAGTGKDTTAAAQYGWSGYVGE